MATEKLLVRGVDGFSPSLKVQFMQAVPDSLRCSLCRNVSAHILMDRDDHTYCKDCINMMNEDGRFTCIVDDAVEYTETLRRCAGVMEKVLGLTVRCPKNACRYQATFQDLLIHYPNCQSGGVQCPLCHTCVSAKDLGHHTSHECPERQVECPYCDRESKQRMLEEHMRGCDLRPATCEHCHTEFDSYAEVRDQHYGVCQKKPIGCPYTRFGCTFKGIREEVNAHVQENQHIEILLKSFERLQRELEVTKDEVKQLKEKIRNVEFGQSEELQHRLSLEDEVKAGATEIKALNMTVDSALKMATEETHREVQELSRRMETFTEPMEELLKNIAAHRS